MIATKLDDLLARMEPALRQMLEELRAIRREQEQERKRREAVKP